MFARRTIRKYWSAAEVWPTICWPTNLQKSSCLLCFRGRLPQRTLACRLWRLHHQHWFCITWSACVLLIIFVHSACDCALVWQLSTSGTSTWGASATSAVQTEVRPSYSSPDSREETTAFPPFIRHAPPLIAVCELCLSPCASKSFLPLLFCFFCCSRRRSRLFSDQQRLYCSLPEHTGARATDVLYSALRRICPFQGSRISSVTYWNICESVTCEFKRQDIQGWEGGC